MSISYFKIYILRIYRISLYKIKNNISIEVVKTSKAKWNYKNEFRKQNENVK